MEKETLGKLKKLGFPVLETPATNVTLLPRASNCLVRRLQALCPLIADLEKVEKAQANKKDAEKKDESFITKTLWKYASIHRCCMGILL